MIRYAYQLKDFRSWLNGFSKILNVPATGGRIDIPPALGEGYLLAANVNPGLSYVVMDFSLKEDLVLLRKRSSAGGLSLFFNQVAISDHNIFFSTTNYELEITYSANSRMKRVGIFLSPSFAGHRIKKKIRTDLLLYAEGRLRNINKEPIGFEYRQLLEDLFEAEPASPLHHLLRQNRILSLMEKFLHAFLTKPPLPQPADGHGVKGKEKDLEALKAVEQILSDTQLYKFPSIDHLSRAAMMSSTKLKTKFKQVYGMKLYEFYNHNRLGQAKEMLKTGDYSVKQVGVTIGFSNLSNFAKAFRKEFGILPKEVLKSK
ncbi:MAG TPA: helix-turn-helix transcriptional regulator [Puia sp.]|jgi:AraC-like DNA-binding protein